VGIGPVPVSAGIQPTKIQNLNLNSKNKKFLKILQVAMNLMVSNFLKNPFIYYSLHGFKVKSKKKNKKMGRPIKTHRSNRPVNRLHGSF